MSGPFIATLMDPPWNESGGGRIKRGADRHYPLIKSREGIRDTILQSGVWNPAQDAHLWMWVTNNFLLDGGWLFGELGFRYVTNFVWTKPGRMGIGQYGRGCHELLLFGVRGSGYKASAVYPIGHPKAGKMRRNVRTDFLAGIPRPKDDDGKIVHSRKPFDQYTLIDLRTAPGPRLEMFARRPHPGWVAWGNEVNDG